MKSKFIRAIIASAAAAVMLFASSCEFNTYIMTGKTPEQSINSFFKCLQSCKFSECDKYLANNASFNISNDTGYEFVDVLLEKQMSSLQYSIMDEAEIDGGNASCRVQVTSLDAADIESALTDEYAKERSAYMKENKLTEIPLDDQSVINELAASSFSAISDSLQPTAKEITIELTFQGGRWRIISDDELCEAVLGGSIE